MRFDTNAAWRAEAVGKVRGYPKTPEAYEARLITLKTNSDRARATGRTSRFGVPNGWAGRREEVARLRQKACDTAWEHVSVIYRNSQYADERLVAERIDDLKANPASATTDAERSSIALAFMVSVVISPAYGTYVRDEAARALLPFVRPKPAKGHAPTGLDAALAFLDGLVETETAVARLGGIVAARAAT